MSTTFSMNFDFTTSQGQQTLQYLQQNGYSLIGFKGAQGPQQVSVGVPAWFNVPFGNIFGMTEIDYTPQYKVYAYNQAQIGVNTTIQMQALSTAIGLGSSVTFTQTGAFNGGGVPSVPSDSIGVLNSAPATTPPITIGLAGLVSLPTGNQYLPFCAFKLNPQSAIIMKPLEQVLLVAAQLNLQSGNVQANLSAPGCDFAFTAATPSYNLMVTPGTYAITNTPGSAIVNPVSAGTTVSLINSPL